MSTDACRELRPALGAVALGGASSSEELAVRAHVEGCPECRAELRDLRAVAAALPLADPAHVTGDLARPSPALADQVLGRVAAERTARRMRMRHRFVAAAATAAAIAAAVVTLALVLPGGAGGTKIEFPAQSGVRASATLHSRSAGTEVAFRVSGLRDGEYYWLWLTGDDGDRIPAGTFRGSPGQSDVVMTAALPLAEARRIWVTDEHDRVVLDRRIGAATS